MDGNKAIEGVSKKSWLLLERFVAIFLPLLIIISSVAAAFHYFEIKSEMVKAKAGLSQGVEHQLRVITNDLQDIVSDLMVLSDLKSAQKLFKQPTVASRAEVANTMLSFSMRKGIYDQIRYLDASGQELVRVDFNNGYPAIVAQDQLQNKSKRYYFRDAYTLAQNEIFVSPFDLNIEHGDIETPLKPMIRFATPIFDNNGNKLGVVLINYLGEHLIQNLHAAANSATGQIMLLNQQGYWLSGVQPEELWGFMFPERLEGTFGNKFPKAWQQILRVNSGQVMTNHGLFTFTAVYPLASGQQSSSGSGSAFAPSASRMKTHDYYWKIVSFISTSTLQARRNLLFNKFIYLYFFVVLLGGVGSWFLARSRLRNQLAKEALHDSEEKFRAVSNSAIDAIIMINSQGRIAFWNPAAERIFGHLRAQIIDEDLHDILAPSRYHEKFRQGMAKFRINGGGNIIGKVKELKFPRFSVLQAYRKKPF
jgi:PAS domain-containing protein